MGIAKNLGLPRVFYRYHAPTENRASPMFAPQAGPNFTEKTAQQKKVAEAGKKCGKIIKANPDFEGSGGVEERRRAMGDCIREEFGQDPIYGEDGWYKR